MGLIGTWLNSLSASQLLVVMSPLTFLVRPSRWLWAIHGHRGSIAGGPNFAYELCTRRIDDSEIAGLDLSSWRIAFTGAEAVNPNTIQRFTERFAESGLRAEAITPVYGLAESTVALTVPPTERAPVIDHIDRRSLARAGRALPVPPTHPAAVQFVSCGPPLAGHEVRIVGESGGIAGDRQEGRIEFRGPSATSGYYRNEGATQRLRDGDWLDSGDLGYRAQGELYVTGRAKDIVIRAGRNLHPAELEAAVGEIPGVRMGCVAAFGSVDATALTDRLVVLAETNAVGRDEHARIRGAVIALVARLADGPPDDVVIAPPGSVPKTPNGKIRRSAAKAHYERTYGVA